MSNKVDFYFLEEQIDEGFIESFIDVIKDRYQTDFVNFSTEHIKDSSIILLCVEFTNENVALEVLSYHLTNKKFLFGDMNVGFNLSTDEIDLVQDLISVTNSLDNTINSVVNRLIDEVSRLKTKVDQLEHEKEIYLQFMNKRGDNYIFRQFDEIIKSLEENGIDVNEIWEYNALQ